MGSVSLTVRSRPQRLHANVCRRTNVSFLQHEGLMSLQVMTVAPKYCLFFGNIYESVQHLILRLFYHGNGRKCNVANPLTRISSSSSSSVFLQVAEARWASAAVVSPRQRFSGSEELGEEEPESASTSAAGRSAEASSASPPAVLPE